MHSRWNPRVTVAAVIEKDGRFLLIEEETKVEIQRIDERQEQAQVERLRALRIRRNKAAWEAAIGAIEYAAKSGENLMPSILEAVEAGATVGEISDSMRKVFGEYHETVVI